MKLPSYEHVNDPVWIKKRKKDWENIFYREMDEQAKYRWKYKEKYYFDGDVDSYIEGNIKASKREGGSVEGLDCPHIPEGIIYSPAETKEQLIEAIQSLVGWFQLNREKVLPRVCSGEMASFLNTLPRFVGTPEVGFSPQLADEMFFWIYGEEYDSNRVFPIPLGPDNWQPKLINYSNIFFLIVRRYVWCLFDENIAADKLEVQNFIFESKYQRYLLSMLPYVDVEFFSKELFDDRYISKKGDLIGGYQLVIRRFFMSLLGYKRPRDKKIFCRDFEKAEDLKRKILNLNMPPEFEDFVDFINEQKENAYRYTE